MTSGQRERGGKTKGDKRTQKEEKQRKEQAWGSSSGNHGTQASRSWLNGEPQTLESVDKLIDKLTATNLKK